MAGWRIVTVHRPGGRVSFSDSKQKALSTRAPNRPHSVLLALLKAVVLSEVCLAVSIWGTVPGGLAFPALHGWRLLPFELPS